MEERAQHFELILSGEPKSPEDLLICIPLIHQRVIRIDPNAALRTYDFMKRRYRLIWTGLPLDFYQIDTAINAVIRYGERYLDDWSMAIEFFKVERSGGE